MTNITPLSFSLDVSPVEFAKLMYKNTDSNGKLNLHGWYDVEKDDTTSFKDYSCKIKWGTDSLNFLIANYKKLFEELKIISKHLDELNEMYLNRTNPYIEATNGILKSEQLEATYFIFVAPFDAKTKEQLDVQVVGRVGRERCGYEMIRHAQRLCRLMQLNAPEKVISNEGRMLIASMAIFQCGINNIKELLENFIEIELGEKIENNFIYNEFSLQHELGVYLRKQLGDFYTVKFERHIADVLQKDKKDLKDTVKHEIDIAIQEVGGNAKYGIELKFPTNGQYPEQMFSFIKDVRFCEQMLNYGFTETYCLTVVDDAKFYNKGTKKDKIYSFFRTNATLKGTIPKPTGEDTQQIELSGEYQIKWQQVLNASEKYRYYLIKPKI